jgi:hypothetical protein
MDLERRVDAVEAALARLPGVIPASSGGKNLRIEIVEVLPAIPESMGLKLVYHPGNRCIWYAISGFTKWRPALGPLTSCDGTVGT